MVMDTSPSIDGFMKKLGSSIIATFEFQTVPSGKLAYLLNMAIEIVDLPI